MTRDTQSKRKPAAEDAHLLSLYGEVGRITGLTFGRDDKTGRLCERCMEELLEALRENDFTAFALLKAVVGRMAIAS